jgi:hypothetical protein
MTNQSSDPYRPPSANDPLHQNAEQEERSIIYVFACLVWCGLAIVVIILRPFLLSLFEDFGMALPAVTIWLLDPAQNVVFVLIAGGVLLAGLFVKNRDGRRRIGQCALVLAVVAVAVLLLGYGFPLLRLLQELS